MNNIQRRRSAADLYLPRWAIDALHQRPRAVGHSVPVKATGDKGGRIVRLDDYRVAKKVTGR